MTETKQELQYNFSGQLYNKHVTGELFLLIGIDRYSKWPIVRICKSTETKDFINVLENFINLYGVPEKKNP